ncbi:MAG: ABC transporter permease, partial [Candidatus Heimdallarchaeota archaeon]|nr:ABC transporter permease [Candidatus Heimdallarchaeota archaeon]
SLKLSNYSQLNNSSTELIIPGYWYWKLPIITLILSLDMNFYSINSLIKIHIDEGEIVEERRPPFWQRYYLDLIFFFLGTGFWVFIHLYEFEIPYMKELLMIALGVPLLVVFIFFTPLVISRYFGDVIGLISEKLWLVYAGFISLAMRNMKKNKYSSSLLASLLILGLMLSFTSMIIPETFNGNNLENIQYDLGADIYISGLDSSNSELWDKIKVDGVESYSQIHKISIQFDDKKFIILGVDPSTFADAAFWKASYAKNSLSEILASINEVSSVAIQSDILEIEGYEIGEQMSLNGSLPSLVDISNEFKYFPNLVNHLPVNNFESILERYLLTNLPTSHALFEYFSSISTHTVGVYAKLSNNANSTKVVASLRAEFSDYSHISITSVDEKLENSVSNLITEVLLNAVQGLLIITIIISFLAMSYYSYITLSERRKEIGVYRAVGMVQKQVFYMFILEGMVMLFVSFIFGSLIGIFISFNFLSIFVINNTGSVPPFSIVFPWKDVFIYSSVLILISIFSAGVPAYKISNKQTGSILRAE